MESKSYALISVGPEREDDEVDKGKFVELLNAIWDEMEGTSHPLKSIKSSNPEDVYLMINNHQNHPAEILQRMEQKVKESGGNLHIVVFMGGARHCEVLSYGDPMIQADMIVNGTYNRNDELAEYFDWELYKVGKA